MGILVRQNKKTGKYRLISTVSDARLHNEPWVTLDEAKRVLIERAFWKFIDAVNEIEMDFPDTWRVNDKPENRHPKFPTWWLENCNDPQAFLDKFNEVIKRTGADIDPTSFAQE